MSNHDYLRNKPYLIDAITGNSAMLAALGANGRMYRLWWPHVDAPQHVDAIRTGLQLEDQAHASWFDEAADGWTHDGRYEERSNVFCVHARSEANPIEVESVHFAVPNHDLFVREYTFTNRGETEQSFSFVLYSSFLISENKLYNTTKFQLADDALMHYRMGYFFALSGADVCARFDTGVTFEQVSRGVDELAGRIIDMQPQGAMSWKVERLAPGASVVLPVYIGAGRSEEQALEMIRMAKSKESGQWTAETNEYWHRYLANATPSPLPGKELEELYDRSLLMFKLMSDEKTGSIIAAPEFDEWFSRCGGYAYCWGRDAAFITTALDKAGLVELSDRFYDWTLTAQSPDGSWDQRHYHDGSLAPSWGLQIDEGASILWGMYEHYRVTHDAGFVRKVWPAVRRGAKFLVGFLDEASGLPKPSKDLWEEREASHTYSSAAVYGGLKAAASFAELSGEGELAAAWTKAAERIAAVIESECWNEARGSFYRGLQLTVERDMYARAVADGAEGTVVELEKGYLKHVLTFDPVIDISLLGIAVPFHAVPADSEKMRRTADAVEAALTSPKVGGIIRYEDDPYIGGNPWILTTLWLAQYRISIGELDKAEQLLQWAIDHRTSTGLLPEQIDQTTGETAWVVPLTWSHAMFVLTVFQLAAARG
jgi:glucoamylase